MLLSVRSIPLACLSLPVCSITRWGNLGGHEERKLYTLFLLSLYQVRQSLLLVGGVRRWAEDCCNERMFW
jgi:hypothetical protein